MSARISAFSFERFAMTTIALIAADSLTAYIQKAQQQPILSEETERALATRYQTEGDLEAARTLVLSHLRLVISVARGFLGYGLPHADLIQEGNIGLMKAVKRFDPTRGVRLVTFALYWIKAQIHEYVLKNWKIVKAATTKAQRKLFFNLRRLTNSNGKALTTQETRAIARDLNVKESDVLDMQTRMFTSDVALDAPFSDESDEAPVDFLADSRFSPEVVLEKKEAEKLQTIGLEKALSVLDSRSAQIIKARWLADSPKTLQELAMEYKVSAERIRQIESQALKKMRETLLPQFCEN